MAQILLRGILFRRNSLARGHFTWQSQPTWGEAKLGHVQACAIILDTATEINRFPSERAKMGILPGWDGFSGCGLWNRRVDHPITRIRLSGWRSSSQPRRPSQLRQHRARFDQKPESENLARKPSTRPQALDKCSPACRTSPVFAVVRNALVRNSVKSKGWGRSRSERAAGA